MFLYFLKCVLSQRLRRDKIGCPIFVKFLSIESLIPVLRPLDLYKNLRALDVLICSACRQNTSILELVLLTSFLMDLPLENHQVAASLLSKQLARFNCRGTKNCQKWTICLCLSSIFCLNFVQPLVHFLCTKGNFALCFCFLIQLMDIKCQENAMRLVPGY